MARTLYIIGAGGHGKVVADCAKMTGEYEDIAFLDVGYPQKQDCDGWPVVGHSDDVSSLINSASIFFVAVGHNSSRQRIYQQLQSLNAHIATLVDPAARVADTASVGRGSLICAGAIVNPAAILGQGVIINTAATVDHDCVIGDYVHIAPGSHLAGTVSVGALSFLGVGTAVIPGIEIGSDVTIGAGTTVLNHIPDRATAVGTPAKVIKYTEH